MSEFKEKVLSEISFAMVDDAPDLQKLYDKVAATDEHSELNDNQKTVLKFLKSKVTEPSVTPISAIVILGLLEKFRRLNTEEERRVLEAYWQLNSKQQAQVITAFAQWVTEQEEA